MIDKSLYQAKAVGFSGIQNLPTVGFIDGNFRANLEGTGMTYQLEVDLVKRTHDKYVFTSPHVFWTADATAIATIGLTFLFVIHNNNRR
ncbi:MAG: putative TIM-barrel enzyme [Cellvibrionaceae bacterium]|jgi:predicted TIM-barrel enzyme